MLQLSEDRRRVHHGEAGGRFDSDGELGWYYYRGYRRGYVILKTGQWMTETFCNSEVGVVVGLPEGTIRYERARRGRWWSRRTSGSWAGRRHNQWLNFTLLLF